MTIPPYEIDGNPARDRQRGAAEDFPFPVPGATYLGDSDVVEGLLRTLAAGVVKIRTDYNADTLTGPESTAAVSKLVDDAAKPFYGADSAYQGLPSWNVPEGGLVPFLKARGYTGSTAAEVVETALLVFAHRILDGMIAHEQDGDDEAGKFSVDSAVEDMVADLMGLPADAEDREAGNESPQT